MPCPPLPLPRCLLPVLVLVLVLLPVLAPCGSLLAVHAHPASLAELPALGEPEEVSTGHLGLEGPVAAPDGSIFFSDVSAAKILRFVPETGQTHVLDPESGGANGLAFAGDALVRCEGASRRVTRTDAPLEPGGPASAVVLADAFQGQAFNAPNDVVVLANASGMFFTDPWYGDAADRRMEVEGVYALAMDGPGTPENDHLGAAVRVLDTLTRPNGVALSPDGATLYVADEGEKKIFAYRIVPGVDGGPPGVNEGRLFADVGALGNPDGMCTDRAGRVYVALYATGRLLVLSPKGLPLALTPTGERTSNVCLDLAQQHAYVTAGATLLRFGLNVDQPADTAPKP